MFWKRYVKIIDIDILERIMYKYDIRGYEYGKFLRYFNERREN